MSTATEKTAAKQPPLPAAAAMPPFAVALRISSVVLVVLAIGTAIPLLLVDDGIHRVGFAYIAARWSNPYWQVWDLLLVWLAIGHGGAGVWRLTADAAYSRRLAWRTVGFIALGVAFTLATVSILTFDPTLI